MKASLSDLAVELRLEASGLADSKLINNIARREIVRSWAEQLDALTGDGQPIGKLSVALALLESVAKTLHPVRSSGLTNIAATYVRSMIEVLHAEAKLDASLAKANRNPATSADSVRADPPPGTDGEFSKAGGR